MKSPMTLTRSFIVGGVVAGALAAAPAAVHAAADIVIASGTVTIRLSTPGEVVVSCRDGFISEGATISAVRCAAATSIRIVGTAGADYIDATRLRRVDFPQLRASTATTRPVMIEGKEGADAVNGSWLPELIAGGPGDDILHAGGGDDLVYGGANADRLTGGWGLDRVNGDSGDDYLVGDESALSDDGRADIISGGLGRERIILTNADKASMAFDTAAPDSVLLSFDRRATSADLVGAGPFQIWSTTTGGPAPDVEVLLTLGATAKLHDGNPDVALAAPIYFTEASTPGWNMRWYAGTLKIDASSPNDLTVEQQVQLPIEVAAGFGTDTLRVTTISPTFTNTGTQITGAGGQPISYSGFESVLVNGA